jgi:hypothetical protein
MQEHFGVSPLFFSSLESETQVVKTGSGASLLSWEGKRVHLGMLFVIRVSGIQPSLTDTSVSLFPLEDGIYRFSSGRELPVAHVWFSHSLMEGKSSTYIIHDCPEKSKRLILSYFQGENIQKLLRPLVIDVFLSEQCLHEWRQELFVPRKDLIEYVCQI